MAAVNAFSFLIAIQPTSEAGRRCDNCPSASSAKELICESRNATGLAEEGHARHVVVIVIVGGEKKKNTFSLHSSIREGGVRGAGGRMLESINQKWL